MRLRWLRLWYAEQFESRPRHTLHLLFLTVVLTTLSIGTTFWPGTGTAVAPTIDESQLSNVDNETILTLSAFRYNRRTRTYFGTAWVTNVSAEPLSVPMYLVVNGITPVSVDMLRSHGRTLAGRHYYELGPLVSGQVLAPGETTGILPLEMTNPQGVQFQPDMSVYIETPPANTPPIADAGPDQTARVTDTVTLDGSRSSDADGDPLTFDWVLVEAPDDSTATLSDRSEVKPNFLVDRPGDYIAELVVNDGFDDSAPDSVTITTLNSPPVADAGPDQTAQVTETVTLDGSGSSDVDGDSLTYAWSFISRPGGSLASLIDPAAVDPFFEVDAPGTYIVQLAVDDGQVESDPDTVTIETSTAKWM